MNCPNRLLYSRYRLYSDFLYFKRKTKSKEYFHETAKAAISTITNCLKGNSLRHCLYIPTNNVLANEVRL